jgi:signal transduction histidine kinase
LNELLAVISNNKNKGVGDIKKPIKKISKLMKRCVRISNSSASMMSYLVDDLLDFSQINAGKFRKTVSEFDLSEALEEVVATQMTKA